jgi:hypothetical protein
MYTHQMQEILLVARADLSSTGVKASWVPGVGKWRVRAVSCAIQNTIGAAGIVRVAYGALGIATTQGTEIAEFDLTTSHTTPNVLYNDGLDVEIEPGEEIIVDVSDAAAAGDLCSVSMFAERIDERPGNLTNLIEETA